jgi:WD40 repeat protein
MKKIYLMSTTAIVGVLLFAGINHKPALPYGFTNGTPEVKSITALTFGPNGVLFIGDSQNASVVAFDTKDTKKPSTVKAFDLPKIDEKIAAALGTTKENITITDMAVNPVSKNLYVAVKSADGTPALLSMSADNQIKAVSLKDVNFSTTTLNNVAGPDEKDGRGNLKRVTSISDMGFADGKLMVSGLSNKEFSSTFRTIAFPFTANKQDEASLEMYHTSHGKYETTSPIRTFTTTTIDGKEYMVASYTCTPLVLFAMDELKSGAHVKGRTIAEMGNQNTPSDMIWLKGTDQNYLVMANTNRPAAKVGYNDIKQFKESLTTPIPGSGGAAFTKLPYEKVLQLDKLDDGRAVVIQKKANGDVDLWTSDGKTI